MPAQRHDSRPVATSQMRAVLSHEPVTTRAPLGLKEADQTPNSWPLRTISSCPLRASSTRAVLSHDATTSFDPSGLNTADIKAADPARSVAISSPVLAFQMRAV